MNVYAMTPFCKTKTSNSAPTVISKDENKKANTPLPIPVPNVVQNTAKSIIVLDIKPWDDETDINAMEQVVRSIEADGLLWGQAQRVPVAYGIIKLQIGCVVEDDKVGTDFLEEKICEFDEYVQSIDIVSFNKYNGTNS